MEKQLPSGPFVTRVRGLPKLGLGVSTEYGAHRQTGALDPFVLAERFPAFAGFLEVGVEVAKGLDADAARWAGEGRPTTYHFLDINLDEPEDFDDAWLARVDATAAQLKPAWMCGDAGLWHFGPREPGSMLLLPPILTDEAASEQAAGIVRLRERTGLEVLPENPPGQVFLGDLHILDFFARVAERADTGLLVDCAHLAIYQRVTGLPWDAALELVPFERVVELHVAGGSERHHDGFPWVDDDHTGAVLEETWALAETFMSKAPNLKAVVYECERNGLDAVVPGFERLSALWATHVGA